MQREIVDLVDDAVDVIAERRALRLDGAELGEHLLGRMAELGQRIDRQAEAGEGRQRLVLALREGRADLAPGIGEELQRPFSGDVRVELAQGAGGGIAGIGEGRLAGGGLTLVDALEILMGEIDLAANLQPLRRAVEPLGDRRDRQHVGGDVLALETVAARGGADELAMLIEQRTGKPVDLRLGDDGEGRVFSQAQEPAHARAKLGHLLVGEDIAERQHRHDVAHFGEFLRRRRANPRRLGVDEFRVGLLQRLVSAAQRVIFGVGDARRVLLMVAPVMLGKLGGEARVLAGGDGVGGFGSARHAQDLAEASRGGKTPAPSLFRNIRGQRGDKSFGRNERRIVAPLSACEAYTARSPVAFSNIAVSRRRYTGSRDTSRGARRSAFPSRSHCAIGRTGSRGR